MRNRITPVEFINAARRGMLTFVKKYILQNKEDETALNAALPGSGDTALIVAIKERHDEIARLLIAEGADVKLCNHKGVGPIHWAAAMGKLDLVNRILAKTN